jgi:hypothetical protein
MSDDPILVALVRSLSRCKPLPDIIAWLAVVSPTSAIPIGRTSLPGAPGWRRVAADQRCPAGRIVRELEAA